MHNKEKKEKKKHKVEDKSKVKVVTEDKREHRKEEAKARKKKTEERKEEEEKDSKGKSRRIAAEDNDATPEEVQEIMVDASRMAALPRRAPRSTHLEVKDNLPSPCGSASGSSYKSSSSNNSTSISNGSSSSSNQSKDSAPKRPVHYKGALKAAKTEPHLLVETHGRPPRKLPAGRTRQEKFTGPAQHVRSIDILKSFFKNQYGYLLCYFVHHYKNCCGQPKSATAAEGNCVHYVRRVVHGGSCCVPRVSRSCYARRIRCACRLRMCPWRPSCRSARVSCPIVREDLGLAPTMLGRAEPRRIQAVPSPGTKKCSSVPNGMRCSRLCCGAPPISGVVNMTRTGTFTCYMGAL